MLAVAHRGARGGMGSGSIILLLFLRWDCLTPDNEHETLIRC